MDAEWQKTFRERMRHFEARRPACSDEISVSIKIRVTSGCFHREHSPHAYEIVDKHLSKSSVVDSGIAIEEHESGPELLVYLTVIAAGVTLERYRSNHGHN